MPCDTCKQVVDSIKESLNKISKTKLPEKIDCVIDLLNLSYEFIEKNCCSTERFKQTFSNKLKEFSTEPYPKLNNVCNKYLNLLEVSQENRKLYFFKELEINFERAMYKVKIDDQNYIAKVMYCDSEDTDNCNKFPGGTYKSDIEYMVYEELKDCSNIPTVVHKIRRISPNNTDYFFKINDQKCRIDFEKFANKLKDVKYFSIIVMEKLEYQLLCSYLNKDLPQYEYGTIFKNVLKLQYKLNQKYGLIHGDLMASNIFINDMNDIKIFDFDMSSINNKTSIRRLYYQNPEPGLTSDKKQGFLLDVFRLFISFHIKNINIFPNNKTIQDLKKLYEKYDKIYEMFYPNQDYFNNLIIFAEWLLEDRYDDILELIND